MKMRTAGKTNRGEVPVPKGTTLIESVPFAYCLKGNLRGELCEYCLKPNPNLRKCTGCLVVSYCGIACQREGWKDHKGECKNLVRVKPKVPTDSIRLIARIILKLQRGGDAETENITSTRARKFKDLMSHYKDIKEDAKRMEQFETICQVLNEYLSDVILPNTAELLGIYGRMCINSFSILNGEMQTIGTGVYLAPSIVDHSCAPNAVVTFDGFKLRLRLIQELPTLDWNSVRISYIELMSSNHDRRKELKDRYYFDCDCRRCHTDDVDRHHYASKCPSCNDPIPAKKGENFPPCTCGYKMNVESTKQFWEVSEYCEQQLLLMQETNYLDICKICLKKQGDLFHDLCLIRSKVLDAAFDSAIQLQFWDAAKDYGMSLIQPFKMWYGSEHPLTAILLLKIFKILLLTSKMDDKLALKYYGEAVDIIKVTHGKASSFYTQEVKPLLYQIRTT